MNKNQNRVDISGLGERTKRVLLETLAVLVAGVAFGFVANGLSPRGLKLTRNYFPTAISSPSASQSTAEVASAAVASTSNSSPAALPAVRTNAKGLQLVSREQAVEFFRDPRYARGAFVFVDARRDELYRAGHIPGAYQFDPYKQEKYLPAVLPVCQAAERVLVYCTGSDCEDSEYAAISLGQAGIASQRLYVFTGGITEWTSNNLPVETGMRNSAASSGAVK